MIEKKNKNVRNSPLNKNPDKAGVSATFTADSNASVSKIVVGESTTVKGVIRSSVVRAML